MNKFLRFVEIPTKVASFFPFLVGTLFAVYVGAKIDILNMILMLVSLLCIDMATTGLNHYKDYKRDVIKQGYHYEIHNPLGQGHVTVKQARIILVILLAIAAVCGFSLFIRTDYIVLLLGGVSFAIGLTYSAGPLPTSRTVLGETLSGLFMGGLIPLISYYIHIYDSKPFAISFSNSDKVLTITKDLSVIVPILWLGLPFVFLIANIMLANNICDVKEDFVNKRYTLPVTMGVPKSIILFKTLVILSVFSIILGVTLKILPFFTLIVIAGIPLLYKQTKTFSENPDKAKTFVNAVKNFLVVSLLVVIGLVLSISFPNICS